MPTKTRFIKDRVIGIFAMLMMISMFVVPAAAFVLPSASLRSAGRVSDLVLSGAASEKAVDIAQAVRDLLLN